MNSGFINRLVGTSIVIVAAIIFIPSILDGEKVHYQDGFVDIPEKPEFKTIDLQERVDQKAALGPKIDKSVGEELESLSADDEALKLDEESQALVSSTISGSQEQAEPEHKLKPQTEHTPSQDKQFAPESTTPSTAPARPADSQLTKMAYVIQLGSFSHKANVEALTQKLKKNGFTTFTRPVKTPNGSLTKVFVGPELDKRSLERKLPELKRLTKLNGRLTQFDVTK